ncbi:hypothetical protein AB3X52_12530 [Nocardioides sp. DS6]|uniref:Uncharacterized protein n=1 Tax=Nocardioides eburneus TaxID=3231482 RepID=A0ABV3T1B9_9ACTN
MLRIETRRYLRVGLAAFTGLAGLAVLNGPAQATTPVPLSAAGSVAIWGPGDTGDGLPSPSLTEAQARVAYTKVVANGFSSAIGLTAAGKVETFGQSIFGVAPPASLANQRVVDIAGGQQEDGAAVTADGHLVTWGMGSEAWLTNLPSASELTNLTAISVATTEGIAAAVKSDGSVIAWGKPNPDRGQLNVPEGLAGVASVTVTGSNIYAIKSDGTAVAWGDDASGQTNLPAVLTDTGDDLDVIDVVSSGNNAVALLSDHSLVAWGSQTAPGENNAVPAELEGKQVAAITNASNAYEAVDTDGNFYVWGAGASAVAPSMIQPPVGVDPADISYLAANDYNMMAVFEAVLPAAKPTITGLAKVGQTLTATLGTFSGEPEEITGQWLRNGSPISGETGATYKIVSADAGKKISYRSTATKGEETASSESAAVTPSAGAVSGSKPTISGTVKVGHRVSVNRGRWTSGTKFAYRWLRNGKAIKGATRSSYTPVAADAGRRLSVRVTGTKSGYTSASKTSSARTVAKGTLSGAKPWIKGKAKVGQKLTAKRGHWTAGTKIHYQWFANGKKIWHATKATLKLTKKFKGKKLVVKVTGTKSGYKTLVKASKPTAKVRR